METGRWVQMVEINGTSYRAEFVKRPFREGLEVRVEVSGEVITIAEMGFGEKALLEHVKAIITERTREGEPSDVAARENAIGRGRPQK